jgi:hypothetical protein
MNRDFYRALGSFPMIRDGRGLSAANERAEAELARIPFGQRVRVSIHKQRSVDQLRYWWALMNYVAEATRFDVPEKLATTTKIALGRADIIEQKDGTFAPHPQSISFNDMDEPEFRRLINQTADLFCREVIPHIRPSQLLDTIQSMLIEPARRA